jgi:hypothetical protein
MVPKPKLTRWRSIPSWLIILFCTIGGILFALIVAWDTIIPKKGVPTPLPIPPIGAVAIHSWAVLSGAF